MRQMSVHVKFYASYSGKIYDMENDPRIWIVNVPDGWNAKVLEPVNTGDIANVANPANRLACATALTESEYPYAGFFSNEPNANGTFDTDPSLPYPLVIRLPEECEPLDVVATEVLVQAKPVNWEFAPLVLSGLCFGVVAMLGLRRVIGVLREMNRKSGGTYIPSKGKDGLPTARGAETWELPGFAVRVIPASPPIPRQPTPSLASLITIDNESGREV